MALELNRGALPMVAAPSQSVNALAPVTLGSGAARAVTAIGTSNLPPLGVALASAPIQGDAVAVADRGNVIAAVAAASLGAGGQVGVATFGRFGPVSAASGVVVYGAGQALSPAAAGEKFSLYINPSLLSGSA